MLKNLKLLRTQQEISQQQLANVIGVSQQSINKYENHSVEPDIDTIIKIADYFSVSVDYLIGRTDNQCVSSEITLSGEEKKLIIQYRKASKKEKSIVRFILTQQDK